MLTKFYGAMGNPPEAEGALALMATALSTEASPEAINVALNRCMIQCRFPVRLPDIFQRIPGTEAGDVKAEKWLAWGIVENFVSKWVRWNSERTAAYVEAGAPELAPRILDAIRLTGGWTVYLRMTDEDFPHLQRRFFDAWETWTQIQSVLVGDRVRLLEMPNVKQLIAGKVMDPEPRPAPAPNRSTWDPQKKRIMQHIEKLRTQRRI